MIIFCGKHPIYDFQTKNFPTKFLKSAYYQPQKVIWGHTSISHEILECQGVVTKSTTVCHKVYVQGSTTMTLRNKIGDILGCFTGAVLLLNTGSEDSA